MLIDYKNVNIYHDDIHILNDVMFHVDEGEFIYIIGKVGSGKSSLLKTIYCELDIEDGCGLAEVLGRDLMKIKRKEIPALRKEMGIIFQDFQLLHDRTVEENLKFVLKSTGWKNKAEISTRIDEVLDAVDMSEKRYSKPKIIIADEPTGNLDPDTANNIICLLKQISCTGTAIVMTTHNISMLNKYPGIVYCCKDGNLNDITKDYNKINLTEE